MPEPIIIERCGVRYICEAMTRKSGYENPCFLCKKNLALVGILKKNQTPEEFYKHRDKMRPIYSKFNATAMAHFKKGTLKKE